MTTRRDILKGSSAVAVIAAMPIAPAIAAASAPPVAPLLSFVVGTPGEHDALFVRASSIQEAYQMWGEQQGHSAGSAGCEICFDGDHADAPCTCDPKEYVTRIKKWDALDDDPTPGQWLDAGFGHICNRCNYETMAGDGYNINGDAVCTDCMTLDDWQIEDPEYYAEQIDELLTDEYGPDLNHPEYW